MLLLLFDVFDCLTVLWFVGDEVGNGDERVDGGAKKGLTSLAALSYLEQTRNCYLAAVVAGVAVAVVAGAGKI